MQWAIPAEPFGLADLRKRHRFLRLKHIFGFIEDDDDGDSDDFDALRVRGVVDLEAMDLSKMVGSGASAATHGSGMGGKAAASGDAGGKAKGIDGVSDANALVEQIRSYQVQLRRVNNKLEEQKRALQDAMQHEIMNNKTGIGETLNGLPLGCLSITLERIEGFMPDPYVVLLFLFLPFFRALSLSFFPHRRMWRVLTSFSTAAHDDPGCLSLATSKLSYPCGRTIHSSGALQAPHQG